jgi:hypothetical protein
VAARGRGVDPKLQLLARYGFLSRGLVYLVIGLVAARAGFLQRGMATGPGGALRRVFELGYGRWVLVAVGAGLLSFALFRLAQASRSKGTARVGYLVGALGALVLTLSAAGVLLGLRRAAGGSLFRVWGAWLLSRPWGREVLLAGGGIACLAGLVEIVRAVLGKLPRDFALALISRENKRWASRLARFGVFAHGIVVVTVGASVLEAALHLDARELLETGGALRRLHLATWPPVFAVLAVGLLAYGSSLVVLAAHRRRSLR